MQQQQQQRQSEQQLLFSLQQFVARGLFGHCDRGKVGAFFGQQAIKDGDDDDDDDDDRDEDVRDCGCLNYLTI